MFLSPILSPFLSLKAMKNCLWVVIKKSSSLTKVLSVYKETVSVVFSGPTHQSSKS